MRYASLTKINFSNIELALKGVLLICKIFGTFFKKSPRILIVLISLLLASNLVFYISIHSISSSLTNIKNTAELSYSMNIWKPLTLFSLSILIDIFSRFKYLRILESTQEQLIIESRSKNNKELGAFRAWIVNYHIGCNLIPTFIVLCVCLALLFTNYIPFVVIYGVVMILFAFTLYIVSYRRLIAAQRVNNAPINSAKIPINIVRAALSLRVTTILAILLTIFLTLTLEYSSSKNLSEFDISDPLIISLAILVVRSTLTIPIGAVQIIRNFDACRKIVKLF